MITPPSAALALAVGFTVTLAAGLSMYLTISMSSLDFFRQFEFDHGRYFLFVPAGVKLLLLFLLRSRSIPGLLIGITLGYQDLLGLAITQAIVIGTALTFPALLTFEWICSSFGLKYPWNRLTRLQLLSASILLSIVDSIVLHIVLIWLELETTDIFFCDWILAVVGRISGCLLVLASLSFIRISYTFFCRKN